MLAIEMTIPHTGKMFQRSLECCILDSRVSCNHCKPRKSQFPSLLIDRNRLRCPSKFTAFRRSVCSCRGLRCDEVGVHQSRFAIKLKYQYYGYHCWMKLNVRISTPDVVFCPTHNASCCRAIIFASSCPAASSPLRQKNLTTRLWG